MTKMRYLTPLFVATATTGVVIGFAPVAVADPGAASVAQVTGKAGSTTAPDPGFWNGGQAAGGTGIDSGQDTANGRGYHAAVADGVATKTPDDVVQTILDTMWLPEYRESQR